ncbi:uncharacterized protein CLUP02_15200 [Colletotrichum lupini]|uniref:Uncharacterized protein n=1 Tax=Colletotrichum lupini TaxID=145971 RepID=A0A9Q8T5H9_9PEZI|nr:uncharacterized protein CLUP02_15200 [Colletotrichum lupini]UQC89669.1 hypothetical protein CLUP02_15200 [Colletotrichum lupini]
MFLEAEVNQNTISRTVLHHPGIASCTPPLTPLFPPEIGRWQSTYSEYASIFETLVVLTPAMTSSFLRGELRVYSKDDMFLYIVYFLFTPTFDSRRRRHMLSLAPALLPKPAPFRVGVGHHSFRPAYSLPHIRIAGCIVSRGQRNQIMVTGGFTSLLAGEILLIW